MTALTVASACGSSHAKPVGFNSPGHRHSVRQVEAAFAQQGIRPLSGAGPVVHLVPKKEAGQFGFIRHGNLFGSYALRDRAAVRAAPAELR